MKHLFYLLLFVSFFTACKPTSAIVTSKKEAVAKGIYAAPIAKKEVQSKPEKKKIVPKASSITNQEDSEFVANTDNTSYLVEQLIHSASDNIGVPYKSGGTTTAGFDCSGFMYCIFDLYNIKLPHSSKEQSKLGLIIEKENAKKGDLIFFKTNGKGQINHVGMVTEITQDEIKFIHSSTSSGIMISSTKEAYYQKSFVQINRILE